MLRATRRVLKPGGRLSFLVIAVADGLTEGQTNRAYDAGPEHVAVANGYPMLLDDAGFVDIEPIDVTDEYRSTQAALIGAWDAEAAGITSLLGAAEFAERQARRRNALTALDEGLLLRWLISASRPRA